jgi:glycosyltransferase involved in cell wall biosynthesis
MRVATVTAVYNEKVLLPQYVAHYAKQVDHMFLIDNDSDDRSLENVSIHPQVTVSKYQTNGEFRYTSKHEALIEVVRTCVGRFDYVLLVDADEFIVPKFNRSIREELEAMGGQAFYWTHGFNIFGMPGEAPYDTRRPIVSQRCYGCEDLHYCKPILVRPEAEVVFVAGMHALEGIEKPSLEECRKSPFKLLHYAGLDEDFYVDRCMVRARRLSEENVKLGYSWQYYSKDPNVYRARFRNMLPHCSKVL